MTFEGVCASCHGFRGQGFIGPKIDQNPLMGDRRGLTTLLENGRGKMPAVGAGWSDVQLNALVAYARQRFAPKGAGGGG
jgi:mono/diheme cytochrome c family protein